MGRSTIFRHEVPRDSRRLPDRKTALVLWLSGLNLYLQFHLLVYGIFQRGLTGFNDGS